MDSAGLFESAIRSTGDLAGVFEHDGETGYFYLYRLIGDRGRSVLGAIRIILGRPDFTAADIAIRWNATEQMVGFFIRGKLWAAFDSRNGARYGGDYQIARTANIKSTICDEFRPQEGGAAH